MSSKLTVIELRGQQAWPGCMDWGTKTAAEMIVTARAHSAHLRKQADIIDAAADSDFRVRVVLGSIANRLVSTIQEGESMSKCSACDGFGEIPYQSGQTPENFEQGTAICSACHGTGTAPTKCKDGGDCGIGGFCDDCPHAPAKCACPHKGSKHERQLCDQFIGYVSVPDVCKNRSESGEHCGHSRACHKEQAND